MEKDKLYKYFANAASEAERSDIRRWVEASPENYRVFLAERKFYDTASMIAGDFEPEAAPERTERRRPLFIRWFGRVAAAVVLVALTLVAEHTLTPAPAAPVPPLTAMTVPAGQRLHIELSDGSTVWLNSNTTLRFPDSFAENSRRVEVEGEAYFTVAKDASRPFSVGTAHGDVVVTGTEFNVEDYPGSGEFKLSLVEGSVNFVSPDTCCTLAPGENISLTGNTYSKGRVECVELEWVRGIISFREQPLRDIIARFEKYYGVTVNFERPEIGEVCFTGKFYLDDGIEHALNAIRHDIRFDYEGDRDFRTITIK